MKLSDYAQRLGISYHTAWRWFKAGQIKGYQAETGTIIVTELLPERADTSVVNAKVAVYARVSAAENKPNLDGQAQRARDYCAAKGWQISQVVKEIGSGINDSRPKLLKLLTDPTITVIVVEHKDRLTRFGFNYLEQLLAMQGRRIEVINLAENGKEDLIQDFVSIVTSFCARLYGQQRVVKAYVDWLIAHEQRRPNKYDSIPESEIVTPLSDRWQRCAWQQACGIVQSWYANERRTPPVLRNLCLQANTNVVVIEPSRTPQFDYWLRISTLEAGRPVRVPLSLYGRARKAIAEFPKLCTGVTLNKRDGQWYATLIVERRNAKPQSSEVVGVDIGMANIVATSQGRRYGQVSPQLRQRLARSTEKRRRKQKLNSCLQKKSRPPVDLRDNRMRLYPFDEPPLTGEFRLPVVRLHCQRGRERSRQHRQTFWRRGAQ